MTWLDELHHASRELRVVSGELDTIERALATCGNVALSEKMFSLRQFVDRARDSLAAGTSGAVSEILTASSEPLHNMVMAALTVIGNRDEG